MRLRWLALTASCLGYAVVQCGGDSGTGDGGPDATTDAPTVDTSPPQDSNTNEVVTNETGTNDSGTTDGGSDTGTSDASDGGGGKTITSWSCGNTTVSNCTACVGFTQPCAYCNMADASDLVGACIQTGTNCFTTIPNGYQDCPCNMDASTCPESYQVCTNAGRCHTCSDNNTNNGLTCENGGKCDYADGGCL